VFEVPSVCSRFISEGGVGRGVGRRGGGEGEWGVTH
jgi:hypothetical protein